MAAVEEMTRDELFDVVRGLKARVAELEGALISRRLFLEGHPATMEACMENVPEAIVLTSAPDGVVRIISRYALDFFELKREEAEGAPISSLLVAWRPFNPDGSFIDEEDRPTVAALTRGVATSNREIIFRKNGKEKTVLVNASPILDSTGKIIGSMTAWREITARKEAEEELKHEKELLSQIIEIMPVGVWIIDSEGKIVEGNEAAKSLWGGARYVTLEKYCEYKAWWADTGKLVSAQEWAASRAFRLGETTLNEELEIEGFDGRRRIILNSAKPLKKNSRIIGAIAINQDITERKRAEEALKQSQRMLAESQRIAHVGNWIWEVDSDRFCGSDETYDIFEIPRGTPVNQTEFMRMLHDDDRETVKAAMEDGLNGNTYRLEFRIVTGKGAVKYVQGIGELARADGRGPVMKGTVQDITERKKQEEEQMRLLEELKEALGKIKTLSGLIPICANCKRIRDDKGYWRRIERYIEERSQAEFTHSLCPDCEEKLYGKEKGEEEE